MKQTLVLRLETNEDQQRALRETIEAFNGACQHVADVAYTYRIANKLALQPLVYQELRNRYGLSSQMAVRAISKACEAYKTDKRVHVQFDPHDPMVLDQRLVSFRGLTHVSMLCLSGRHYIPFRFVRYAPARPDRIPGQADLILENGEFLLHVCIDMETPPPEPTEMEEVSELAKEQEDENAERNEPEDVGGDSHSTADSGSISADDHRQSTGHYGHTTDDPHHDGAAPIANGHHGDGARKPRAHPKSPRGDRG